MTFKKVLSSESITTPTRLAEHVSPTFEPASHEEFSISSIPSFGSECPTAKGTLLCEDPKVSSTPRVLPNETEVEGSSYETSSSSYDSFSTSTSKYLVPMI